MGPSSFGELRRGKIMASRRGSAEYGEALLELRTKLKELPVLLAYDSTGQTLAVGVRGPDSVLHARPGVPVPLATWVEFFTTGEGKALPELVKISGPARDLAVGDGGKHLATLLEDDHVVFIEAPNERSLGGPELQKLTATTLSPFSASWEMYRTPNGRPTFPGIGVIGVPSASVARTACQTLVATPSTSTAPVWSGRPVNVQRNGLAKTSLK
jgi:hypothetical protein